MDNVTVNGEIIFVHSIGIIMLAVNNLNPIKADVLFAVSQVLDVDMLLGMDIIKIQGRVSINQSSEAIFNETDPPACVASWIEERDFSAKFNEHTRVWTVL